jgi:hypothetical protein
MAGVLLLAIGAGLLAWGGPYYMLDWGGTFVIAGAVLASAGLICLLLGTALQRLSALRAELMVLRAVQAVEAAPSVAMVDATTRPPAARGSEATSLPGGQPASDGSIRDNASGSAAGAVLAGGLAAGGLAVAAKSILSAVAPEATKAGGETTSGHAAPGDTLAGPDADAAGDRSGQITLTETATIADAPSLPRRTEPFFDESPGPVSAPDELADATGPERTLTASDRHALDDLLARLAGPVADKPMSDPPLAAPSLPDAGSDGEPAPALWQDTPADPSASDRSDASDAGLAVDDAATRQMIRDDLFARFDQAVRGITRGAGDDVADNAADEGAEQSRPAELATFGEPDDQTADEARANEVRANEQQANEQQANEWQVGEGQFGVGLARHAETGMAEPSVEPQPELPSVAAGQTASHPAYDDDADDDFADLRADLTASRHGVGAASSAPQAAHAVQPEAPTASDEGVVAAYNVGDSAYAMLADGRIRVTTPEGQHLFQSMDELKAFMAARRSAD